MVEVDRASARHSVVKTNVFKKKLLGWEIHNNHNLYRHKTRTYCRYLGLLCLLMVCDDHSCSWIVCHDDWLQRYGGLFDYINVNCYVEAPNFLKNPTTSTS